MSLGSLRLAMVGLCLYSNTSLHICIFLYFITLVNFGNDAGNKDMPSFVTGQYCTGVVSDTLKFVGAILDFIFVSNIVGVYLQCMFPLLPAMPEQPGKLNLSQLIWWLWHSCCDPREVYFHVWWRAPVKTLVVLAGNAQAVCGYMEISLMQKNPTNWT